MTRLLIILLAASFAFTAVAAMAESTVSDSRARLAATWDRAGLDAREARLTERGPMATMRRSRPGPRAGNWQGGRKHPPAGR